MSGDRLYFDLENAGGIAKSLRLVAETEIAFSPQTPRAIRWARGGFNGVALTARGLRLDLLRAVLPGVENDGEADVDRAARSSPKPMPTAAPRDRLKLPAESRSRSPSTRRLGGDGRARTRSVRALTGST